MGRGPRAQCWARGAAKGAVAGLGCAREGTRGRAGRHTRRLVRAWPIAGWCSSAHTQRSGGCSRCGGDCGTDGGSSRFDGSGARARLHADAANPPAWAPSGGGCCAWAPLLRHRRRRRPLGLPLWRSGCRRCTTLCPSCGGTHWWHCRRGGGRATAVQVAGAAARQGHVAARRSAAAGAVGAAGVGASGVGRCCWAAATCCCSPAAAAHCRWLLGGAARRRPSRGRTLLQLRQ